MSEENEENAAERLEAMISAALINQHGLVACRLAGEVKKLRAELERARAQARRDALKEAEDVCDRRCCRNADGSAYGEAHVCATAIRALPRWDGLTPFGEKSAPAQDVSEPQEPKKRPRLGLDEID